MKINILWICSSLTKHIESHVYDNLAWAVDHTVLKPEAKLTDLQKLCTEAIENKYVLSTADITYYIN
jgi:deoxyribose-phosphate aldolase